ncbi:hypothetical protein [Streptomyces sp. CB02923]|uniref:hypothetical protein n=1 Tax=Streptomyces sp. CB02923 TaxID=1718985 RepID=UPI001901C421|nr:hypothetical protein [Streptomyces sp. CB02923]
MSTLALPIVLLLVLVGALVFAGLVYLTLRHSALREPLLVRLGGLAILTGVVTVIVTR